MSPPSDRYRPGAREFAQAIGTGQGVVGAVLASRALRVLS
jgi:hypothetical protein